MPPLGVVPVVVLSVPVHITSPSYSAMSKHFSVVVPDGVAGPQSNPLRDRAVLLLRLRELLLGAERLVRLL